MNYSIKITLSPAEGEFDPRKSHFFGAPLIPQAWVEGFDDSIMFFCQINLAEIGCLDTDGILPKSGFLYVFFDTANVKYSLTPIVRYFDGQPDLVFDDFNEVVDGYEGFTKPLSVSFTHATSDEYCTKLLGEPSDWNYAGMPPDLLMQIDHLDEILGFHDEMDGVSYLFLGKDRKHFTDVVMFSEYS